MTTEEIILAAMRKIGVEAIHRTATAKEISDGLEAFNVLLSSVSEDRLVIYSNTLVSLAITNAKATYTYGDGGDIDSQRPVGLFAIKSGYIRDSNSYDYNLDVINREEYLGEPQKATLQQRPYKVVYDPRYPLADVTFFPWPDQNYTAYLDVVVGLTEVTDVAASLAIPSGYKQMFIYNLAVALAPEYGVGVPTEVGYVADLSMKRIKKNNTPNLVRQCDAGVLGRGGSTSSKRIINGG